MGEQDQSLTSSGASERTDGPDDREPTPERQAELRAAYEANVAVGKPPYAGVVIHTRGELSWIVQDRGWSPMRPLTQLGEVEKLWDGQAIDLRQVGIFEAVLSQVDLNRANLSGALIERCAFNDANFTFSNLSSAHIGGCSFRGADFGAADLSDSDITEADFRNANLQGAKLSGALIISADFRGAVLIQSRMDAATVLGDVDSRRNKVDTVQFDGKSRLLDVAWNGAILAGVNWKQIHRLGDEHAIKAAKSQKDLVSAYHNAARAYRGLSIALRGQGLLIPASSYRLREHVLERKASFWDGKLLSWVFSWLLNFVAGYGERPVRAFFAYLAVLVGFAAAYFALGSGVLGTGTHDVLSSPLAALVFSVTSFHGRGFFPGNDFKPDSLIALLAAVEAIIGLLIEITFIATFTQRFFAR